MSGILTPQKTDMGWVIEIPPEMAQALGVVEGSLAVLHVQVRAIEVEILPPPRRNWNYPRAGFTRSIKKPSRR